MADEVDEVKQTQLVDARARNISHNVRCTECGSQSIEDSQADIAILLRKVDFMDFQSKVVLLHAYFVRYSWVSQITGTSCVLASIM